MFLLGAFLSFCLSLLIYVKHFFFVHLSLFFSVPMRNPKLLASHSSLCSVISFYMSASAIYVTAVCIFSREKKYSLNPIQLYSIYTILSNDFMDSTEIRPFTIYIYFARISLSMRTTTTKFHPDVTNVICF